MDLIKGIGRLFYIINPEETSYKDLEDVPDFVTQAIPYFITFLLLENVILTIRNKPKIRLNDGITSLSNGMYLGCGQILVRGIETYLYVKIYNNWRIYDLPWNSAVTWYTAAIVTDCGYYWLHRAAHEINFMWAQHQVHHSSEEYNLTTALRQSGLQGLVAWIFYLPMAFFVPPPMFLIHQQFNLLFQFWIHTEVIDFLGPLEYVLNTPKHHRIHHGSNRYCLDKNYAGVLIIWDRMFGTFQEEKPGEKIVYGLVEEFKSFNPFYGQFFYLAKLWNRTKEYSSAEEKAAVWLKGPGWGPGKPRLGNLEEVPEIPTRNKYDVHIPPWQNIYVLVHFVLVLLCFNLVAEQSKELSQATAITCVCAILWSLTSIGWMLENRTIGGYSEIIRNLICFTLTFTNHLSPVAHSVVINQALNICFALSVIFLVGNLLISNVSGAKLLKKK